MLKKNLKNYLYHFPLTHADKIVFISKHNLELAKMLGLKNFEYLPHILDNDRWSNSDISEDANEIKSQKIKIAQNNNDKNLVLFIGQMKLRKGWDIMLQAMQFLKSDNVKLIFITPSADEETEELKQMIKNLDIKEQVIFLGKVFGGELQKIYELCDVVAVPSRYEGFGLVVVESWENKKPVVASDITAINEHVINELNGLLVAPKNPEMLANAIKRILSDKIFREKIIQGGTETIKKLKSQEEKNKWLSFYKNLK